MPLGLKFHQCIGEYDILIEQTCKKGARYNIWYVQFLKCCRVKEFNDIATLPLHAEEDFKTWILIL